MTNKKLANQIGWLGKPEVTNQKLRNAKLKYPFNRHYKNIHSKSWIRWIQKSADDFEFSAERLSENAKSIKITLFAELLTVISPIYVQSLQ